jgi:hypothetical protein
LRGARGISCEGQVFLALFALRLDFSLTVIKNVALSMLVIKTKIPSDLGSYLFKSSAKLALEFMSSNISRISSLVL